MCSLHSSAHRASRWALLAAVLAAPLASFAAAAPLTLGEAQALAVARSPQVAGFGHAAQASREMAVAAGALPDPVLKVGVENLPVDGSERFEIGADFMTMRTVGVMQEITRGDKRELRASAARLEGRKAAAQRSLAVANVKRDAALAWFDLRYAGEMRARVGGEIGEARRQVEAADSAYRAGRGAQAELFASRASQAMLEDRAAELDQRVHAARLALERWVGTQAARPLAGAPPVDQPPLPAEDLARHIARHPDLEVLARDEDLAQNAVKLASAARNPDWTVELAYSQRGAAFSNMVSIGVSLPLPWDRANRQDREVAAKLALAEQAHDEREDMLRAHVAEVGAMLAEWRSDRARLERYRRDIVPLAEDRVRAVLAAYRGGKGNLGDVLAARRDALDAQLAALQLEWDGARAWAKLAFLIPDDDSMGGMQ